MIFADALAFEGGGGGHEHGDLLIIASEARRSPR
jgi:hypothetical protein